VTDLRRYYKCGCAPNDDQFCSVGDFLVWTGRESTSVLFAAEQMPEHEQVHLGNLDTYSSYLMRHHLAEQEKKGDYKDVDLDAPEMQPPDEGYDEDPRIVGYPS